MILNIFTLVCILIIAIYFIALLIARSYVNKMLFFPHSIKNEDQPNIENFVIRIKSKFSEKVNLQNIKIQTNDNEILDALHFTNPYSKVIFLYSHGNAGNIYSRLHLFDILGAYGDVLLYDYRGYGLSTGEPSDEGLYNDAYSAWKYLVKEKGYDPYNIILIGRSLGGSITSDLGSRLVENKHTKPRGIVIENTFHSLAQIGTDRFGYPVKWIVNNFPTNKNLYRIGIKCPIILAHAVNDELIPYKHSQMLLEENKHIIFYMLQGTHNTPNYDPIFYDLLKKEMNIKD